LSLLTLAYRGCIRPGLFRRDPEDAHVRTMARLAGLRTGLDALEAVLAPPDDRLQCRLGPLRFRSPIGLAAGLDKHGEAGAAWPALGFGFYELGTITPRPQPGNDRPRVFRLPADGALINRFGFNSEGAEAVAAHLRASRRHPEVPQGINVGKNRDTPAEEAARDHRAVIERLGAFADYFVVNVSSPNTAGLRALQTPHLIEALVRDAVDAAAGVPVFVKVAPDWASDDDLGLTGRAIVAGGAFGLIATNTTLSRDNLTTPTSEAGGLSGRPLRDRAHAALVRLRAAVGPAVPLVGVGGITTVEDAWRRLAAGASLVQVYTALVYEGPGLPAALNRGLSRRLAETGLQNVAELTGLEAAAQGSDGVP